jgi:hypothetical protein
VLAVPRARLDSLSWDGRLLGVHIAADEAEARIAPICLPIDTCLVEAMGSAFGDSIRWRWPSRAARLRLNLQ